MVCSTHYLLLVWLTVYQNNDLFVLFGFLLFQNPIQFVSNKKRKNFLHFLVCVIYPKPFLPIFKQSLKNGILFWKFRSRWELKSNTRSILGKTGSQYTLPLAIVENILKLDNISLTENVDFKGNIYVYEWGNYFSQAFYIV